MNMTKIITPEAAAKQAKAAQANAKYDDAISRWSTLSGESTITGQFLSVMKQLGGLSENLNKILGTVENSIKVLGL